MAEKPGRSAVGGDPGKPAVPASAGRVSVVSLRKQLRQHALTVATLGIAVVIWLAFPVAAADVFLNSRIYSAFATTTPLFAMIALALTLVVITREMDLSFGSVM